MWSLKRLTKELGEIFVLIFFVFLIRTTIFSLYKVPSGSMETTMLVGEYYFADKLSYWFRAPRRGEIIACNQPTYVYSSNALIRTLENYVSIPPIGPLKWIQFGPENWTKRIIGLPGEHVRGFVENGVPVIYVNGVKLDEPYINQYPLIGIFTHEGIEILRDRNYNGPLYGSMIDYRSYNPALPFNKQDFYYIDEARIMRDRFGNPVIKQPLPERPDARYGTDQNYWNGTDTFNVHLAADEYWIMGDNRLGSQDSRYFGPIKGNSIHARIIWRLWSIDSRESFGLLKHPIQFWSWLRWKRFFTPVI